MKILKKYSNGGKAVKGKDDKGLSKKSKTRKGSRLKKELDKGIDDKFDFKKQSGGMEASDINMTDKQYDAEVRRAKAQKKAFKRSFGLSEDSNEKRGSKMKERGSKMQMRKDLVKVYENGGTPEKEGPFPKARIIKPEDKWKKESYNTSDKMKDHKGDPDKEPSLAPEQLKHDPRQAGAKLDRKRRAKRLLKKSYGPASATGSKSAGVTLSSRAKGKKRKYVKNRGEVYSGGEKRTKVDMKIPKLAQAQNLGRDARRKKR